MNDWTDVLEEQAREAQRYARVHRRGRMTALFVLVIFVGAVAYGVFRFAP